MDSEAFVAAKRNLPVFRNEIFSNDVFRDDAEIINLLTP